MAITLLLAWFVERVVQPQFLLLTPVRPPSRRSEDSGIKGSRSAG